MVDRNRALDTPPSTHRLLHTSSWSQRMSGGGRRGPKRSHSSLKVESGSGLSPYHSFHSPSHDSDRTPSSHSITSSMSSPSLLHRVSSPEVLARSPSSALAERKRQVLLQERIEMILHGLVGASIDDPSPSFRAIEAIFLTTQETSTSTADLFTLLPKLLSTTPSPSTPMSTTETTLDERDDGESSRVGGGEREGSAADEPSAPISTPPHSSSSYSSASSASFYRAGAVPASHRALVWSEVARRGVADGENGVEDEVEAVVVEGVLEAQGVLKTMLYVSLSAVLPHFPKTRTILLQTHASTLFIPLAPAAILCGDLEAEAERMLQRLCDVVNEEEGGGGGGGGEGGGGEKGDVGIGHREGRNDSIVLVLLAAAGIGAFVRNSSRWKKVVEREIPGWARRFWHLARYKTLLALEAAPTGIRDLVRTHIVPGPALVITSMIAALPHSLVPHSISVQSLLEYAEIHPEAGSMVILAALTKHKRISLRIPQNHPTSWVKIALAHLTPTFPPLIRLAAAQFLVHIIETRPAFHAVLVDESLEREGSDLEGDSEGEEEEEEEERGWGEVLVNEVKLHVEGGEDGDGEEKRSVARHSRAWAARAITRIVENSEKRAKVLQESAPGWGEALVNLFAHGSLEERTTAAMALTALLSGAGDGVEERKEVIAGIEGVGCACLQNMGEQGVLARRLRILSGRCAVLLVQRNERRASLFASTNPSWPEECFAFLEHAPPKASSPLYLLSAMIENSLERATQLTTARPDWPWIAFRVADRGVGATRLCACRCLAEAAKLGVSFADKLTAVAGWSRILVRVIRTEDGPIRAAACRTITCLCTWRKQHRHAIAGEEEWAGSLVRCVAEGDEDERIAALATIAQMVSRCEAHAREVGVESWAGVCLQCLAEGSSEEEQRMAALVLGNMCSTNDARKVQIASHPTWALGTITALSHSIPGVSRLIAMLSYHSLERALSIVSVTGWEVVLLEAMKVHPHAILALANIIESIPTILPSFLRATGDAWPPVILPCLSQTDPFSRAYASLALSLLLKHEDAVSCLIRVAPDTWQHDFLKVLLEGADVERVWMVRALFALVSHHASYPSLLPILLSDPLARDALIRPLLQPRPPLPPSSAPVLARQAIAELFGTIFHHAGESGNLVLEGVPWATAWLDLVDVGDEDEGGKEVSGSKEGQERVDTFVDTEAVVDEVDEVDEGIDSEVNLGITLLQHALHEYEHKSEEEDGDGDGGGEVSEVGRKGEELDRKDMLDDTKWPRILLHAATSSKLSEATRLEAYNLLHILLFHSDSRANAFTEGVLGWEKKLLHVVGSGSEAEAEAAAGLLLALTSRSPRRCACISAHAPQWAETLVLAARERQGEARQQIRRLLRVLSKRHSGRRSIIASARASIGTRERADSWTTLASSPGGGGGGRGSIVPLTPDLVPREVLE